MTDLHKIKITIPSGVAALTSIELDGEPLRGVTVASFVIGPRGPDGAAGMAIVTLQMYADLLIEGEAQIVQTWRQALPWWRRLPYWMRLSRCRS